MPREEPRRAMASEPAETVLELRPPAAQPPRLDQAGAPRIGQRRERGTSEFKRALGLADAVLEMHCQLLAALERGLEFPGVAGSNFHFAAEQPAWCFADRSFRSQVSVQLRGWLQPLRATSIGLHVPRSAALP